MKTKLISLLLSCVLLLSLAACAKEGSGSDETTKESTVQTTEEVTTEVETTTEEPAVETELNTDVFTDIGLTYSQLTNKHGKLIATGGAKGGFWYSFENGFGQYFWSWEDVDWGEDYPPRDENNQIIVEYAALPKENIPCMEIVIVDAMNSFPATEENVTKIFSNNKVPETFSALENIIRQTLGITDVKSHEEIAGSNHPYPLDTYQLCGFYGNNSIQISTHITDKLEIDSFLDIIITNLT